MPAPAPGSRVPLRAIPLRAGVDSGRGLVRVAPSVLTALGARPYAVLRLTGARTTCALAASAGADSDRAGILVDALTLNNLGIAPGEPIDVEVVPSLAADRLVLAGPPPVMAALSPQTARLMLLGKAVMPGDCVSMLQQDFALPDGADERLLDGGRQQVQALFGNAWQAYVLTVVEAPPVPSVVTMTTAVTWQGGEAAAATAPRSDERAAAQPASTAYAPPPPGAASLPDLPGAEAQARDLRELLDVGLDHPDLLARLGTSPSLGVLLSGPPGSGKVSLVRQVAASLSLTVSTVWCPDLAALRPDSALRQLAALKSAALGDPGARGVLVLEDVEALAPDQGDSPLGPAMVDLVRAIVTAGRAVVAVTATPDGVDRDLLAPDLLSHRLVLRLPDERARRALLAHLTQPLPLAGDVSLDEIAGRTPGFVAADLACLVGNAAQHAAERERAAPTPRPQVGAADFAAAATCVHPSSMDGQLLDPGTVSLADIGGLTAVKQVLTETVLWPIAYPDTFVRMGVSPTRGVLLYGPPGCGKTYLVKALAHDGRANVLSVKGAELLSKWVGDSEAGVRQLFARARGAAPTLIFLDEVDALARTRGSGTDDVGDRVVAALLTEMDGLDQLQGVVVIAATNRPDMVDPALLRPGRLERLLFVPPPDASARAEILTSAAAHTPVDPSVDLTALAAACEGFSGADCAGLVRQAALAAMRRSMDAPSVTAADVRSALTVVRPSLDPAQVAALRGWADRAGARAS